MLCFKTSSFYCLVFSIIICSINQINGNTRYRIAIVGGGIGGTTAAYRLTHISLRYNYQFDLDLYEPNEIGGRLATTFVNGFEFETGGSIIHDENLYMDSFVKAFNLSRFSEPVEYQEEDKVGFYDGKEFVYTSSYWEFVSLFKLWWRYGWDLISLVRKLIDPLLSQFKRIYKLQEENETFDDVQSFLVALDPSFPPLLKKSIKQLLSEHGFGTRFVKEFVYLATNINYNQNTGIHAFVGAVALAGAQASLWSVQGGNKKVPEALLTHSDARLIKKRVESIYLLPNSKYALSVEEESSVYDYVIVACPIISHSEENIQFEGFPEPIFVPVKYQKTVATLVHGELNHTFFNYESVKDLPNNIFALNSDSFFNSISVLNPVIPDKSYDRKVFKVFSKEPLTSEQFDSLFVTQDNVTVREWLAYPSYDILGRNLTFVLHDNLFHINAMEWAASAMEMSAISGVNAALHVLKSIQCVKKY